MHGILNTSDNTCSRFPVILLLERCPLFLSYRHVLTRGLRGSRSRRIETNRIHPSFSLQLVVHTGMGSCPIFLLLLVHVVVKVSGTGPGRKWGAFSGETHIGALMGPARSLGDHPSFSASLNFVHFIHVVPFPAYDAGGQDP